MSTIEIDPERFKKFERGTLGKGAHANPPNGVADVCVMEWAAYLAREPHSDHPVCVSPVIGAFLRSFNDGLDDDKRQLLKPYAIQVIGTASSSEIETRRAWMATDWIIRTYLPAWLDLAKLTNDAETIRRLPQITAVTLTQTMPTLNAARSNASAAWAAARAAAGDAAGAAAGAAAGDAAWDAAGAAAWAAARAAAVAAAWAAARAAAVAAAWDAAGDAAGAAAGAAAWDAAGAAARAAARKKLAPTVEVLQASALELLDRMIAEGK